MNPIADGPPIPPGSPLAVGWRAQIVAILKTHGLADVLDAVVAYAELCCDADPDNCSAAEEAAQGGWYRMQQPAKRRMSYKAEWIAALKRANPSSHPKRIKV